MQIRRAAEAVRRWLDRRFFREAYNAEQILGELASKVRTIVETRPLLETVAHQIADVAARPARGDSADRRRRAASRPTRVGYANLPAVPVRAERLAHARMRNGRFAKSLDAELVLPLSANQKLIGVMGLGPKQSEEPFTSADIRLLDAVATQTGLALENSRLTAEIATEIANREKAKRELEIAREVQERLFPQELPPIAGVEYAGACRPALGVGGDYYDFIPFGGNELGIAIGDVSGKGIPAALLMATLRAYLRGQTIGGEADLAAMMANLNRLVYESSASNRYATFFYGQYDAATPRAQLRQRRPQPADAVQAVGDGHPPRRRRTGRRPDRRLCLPAGMRDARRRRRAGGLHRRHQRGDEPRHGRMGRGSPDGGRAAASRPRVPRPDRAHHARGRRVRRRRAAARRHDAS